MNLQDKQFEALKEMVGKKIEVKTTSYEEIKNYVEELAKHLRSSHDCTLSEDDGCGACRAIGHAEDAILTNLHWMERTSELVDEVIDQEMQLEK